MKKKIITFILAGTLGISLCSCGSRENKISYNTTNIIDNTNITDTTNATNMTDTTNIIDTTNMTDATNTTNTVSSTPVETETLKESKANELSFSDLKNLVFYYQWHCDKAFTDLTIQQDGSFSDFSQEYYFQYTTDPNESVEVCRLSNFNGQFTQPVKVNDYTYSMQISDIHYTEEPGKEEIKDGILYSYCPAFGLYGAENILIYLPGTPIVELPEDFIVTVERKNYNTQVTELPVYALYNQTVEDGFYSYNIVDFSKKAISDAEMTVADLQNSINNDSLTQEELNEKTQELYEVWDEALNCIWDDLKQVKDQEYMNLLTEEERKWIALKEQEVADAGKEVEDGSAQQMMNLKAAEMTKDRIYELLDYLENK